MSTGSRSLDKDESPHISIQVPAIRVTLLEFSIRKIRMEVICNGQKYPAPHVSPVPVDQVSHRFQCEWSDAILNVPLVPWKGSKELVITLYSRKRKRGICIGTTHVDLGSLLENTTECKTTLQVGSTMFPSLNIKIDLLVSVNAPDEILDTWRLLEPKVAETEDYVFCTGDSEELSLEELGRMSLDTIGKTSLDRQRSTPRASYSGPPSIQGIHTSPRTMNDSSIDLSSSRLQTPISSIRRGKLGHTRKIRQASQTPLKMDLWADTMGVMYLEIISARNLPKFRSMTGFSFDMDPFVVISFGKKTFKTPYCRHTINPTYNQKLLVVVDPPEAKYDVLFSIWDKDRITLNDRVAESSLSVADLMKHQPPINERGLYDLSKFEARSMSLKFELVDGAQDRLSRFFSSEKSEISSPEMLINYYYLPYACLRQQLWQSVVDMYISNDEDGGLNFEQIKNLLNSLGSTLSDASIRGFFDQHKKSPEIDVLTNDELVMSIEQRVKEDASRQKEESRHPLSDSVSLASVTPSGATTPVENAAERLLVLRVCPMCQRSTFKHKHELASIKHLSICASRFWAGSDTVVLDGRYVTSKQASRRWYTRFLSKFSFGSYQLGANSANILVQDRLTGQINEEKMSAYVRFGMRVIYATGPMETRRVRKMLKKYTLKQGIKYDSPSSASSILPFIKFHNLDMTDVLAPVEEFKTFNEFFYRALKPGSRTVENSEEPRTAVSLADCRLTVFPTVKDAQSVWIKGKTFSIKKLLSDAYPDDAKNYEEGSLAIFRLAPQDYHRFHVPVDGILGEPKHIEGTYYTVNPMAIRSYLDVYGENARTVVPLDSPQFGRVMIVLIGAMMVGSIVVTAEPHTQVKRADELGYFKFGGSTCVVLFPKGRIVFDADIESNSLSAVETLMRVGMSIGHTPEIVEHVRNYDTRKSTIKRAHTNIVGGGSYMPFSLD